MNEQELEYSYAAHGVDTNIYDSVLQQEDGYCDNNNQVVVHGGQQCPVFKTCGKRGHRAILLTETNITATS